MIKLFKLQYGKHGNKAVPVPGIYVGIKSTCSSPEGEKPWESNICGCDNGCDACDSYN